MVVAGLERCFIAVPDLSRSLAFYQGVLGLERVAEGPLSPDILRGLWGLGRGTEGRSICLRNTSQTTALELVSLDPSARRSAREGSRIYDHGLFDIAFHLANARRAAPSLPTYRETIMTEELLSKRGEIGAREDVIVAEEGCPRERSW